MDPMAAKRSATMITEVMTMVVVVAFDLLMRTAWIVMATRRAGAGRRVALERTFAPT
jgi:hypothetical protein